MSQDTEFVNGLIFKAPNENAPEYVKAKLSIKREELIAWLSQRDGEWVNADVKVSQNGKWYCALDNWKPNGERKPQRQAPTPPPADDFDSDSIPF